MCLLILLLLFLIIIRVKVDVQHHGKYMVVLRRRAATSVAIWSGALRPEHEQ